MESTRHGWRRQTSGWEFVGPSRRSAPIRQEEDVPANRNLYCLRYDGCLDEAVRRDWSSWTCEDCALFAARPGPRGALPEFATQRRDGEIIC